MMIDAAAAVADVARVPETGPQIEPDPALVAAYELGHGKLRTLSLTSANRARKAGGAKLVVAGQFESILMGSHQAKS